MSRKPNYASQVIAKLQELHKAYPTYNIGRHLSTALADYTDFYFISDKELLFALEKYEAELSLDEANIVSDDYVKMIEKDAANLFTEGEEEEEDYE